MKKIPKRWGLVLSGGGARGAYEAGVMHYIRTALKPHQGSERVFQIKSGSSVGAINTCFMASMAHDPFAQGAQLYTLWKDLRQEWVYKRNMKALASFVGRTSRGVLHNLLTVTPFKSKKNNKIDPIHFKGFLDTSPLPHFLKDHINFKKLHQNVQKGPVDAVSLTATNLATGKMELFINRKHDVPYTGEYPHHFVKLEHEHPMASAAIPLIFPPVKVGDTYYTDGGLRLNTPMSPAIQLGATKILIIGLHYKYEVGEQIHNSVPPGTAPSVGQMVGQVMNSLFLDRIQYDIEQMTRINRMIEWSEKVFGVDYLKQINDMLIAEGIRGDIANRGLRKIKVFNINPSKVISEIFQECYNHHDSRDDFSAFEKTLLRILDIDPVAGVDILTYLAFMPSYIEKLLDLGYADAEAHRDEIIEFLTDEIEE